MPDTTPWRMGSMSADGGRFASHRSPNTVQVTAFEFLVRPQQTVDDDELVESTFGKPLQHRGGQRDVLVVIELDFCREHTDAFALVDPDRVFRNLILNQGNRGEFCVQHGSLLLKSKGADDV